MFLFDMLAVMVEKPVNSYAKNDERFAREYHRITAMVHRYAADSYALAAPS
jgi:hypothetical protein